MRLRPPRPPGVTGKPGETTYGGGVQNGESFRIQGKTCLLGEPRGTIST